MSEPATKEDLDNLETRLRTEIRSVRTEVREVRAEVREVRAEVRAEMLSFADGLERRLMTELSHLVNASVERFGTMLGVVDDRYRPLPDEVAQLRADLEAHREDTRVHRKPGRPRS